MNEKLLQASQRVEIQLGEVAARYRAMKDARWMFASAHHNITRQINGAVLDPTLFRDPNQLLRFNMSFATAFLGAVSETTAPPWKKAFSDCARADFLETTYRVTNACPVLPVLPQCQVTEGAAVKACAISMANAHINTDIVDALRTVGCIDRTDYGNMLLFVENGARDAIIQLHGRLPGEVYNTRNRYCSHWRKSGETPHTKTFASRSSPTSRRPSRRVSSATRSG